MVPLLCSVLNQVKKYSKVLFLALVIKLNEQCLGRVAFKENWTSHVIYKDWILQDSSSQHKARCRLCQKSLDCSNMGESAPEAVLSSLPDNPGDTRFWTVSPSLQVRV